MSHPAPSNAQSSRSTSNIATVEFPPFRQLQASWDGNGQGDSGPPSAVADPARAAQLYNLAEQHDTKALEKVLGDERPQHLKITTAVGGGDEVEAVPGSSSKRMTMWERLSAIRGLNIMERDVLLVVARLCQVGGWVGEALLAVLVAGFLASWCKLARGRVLCWSVA